MNKKEEILCGNTLTADQLIQNKGIKYKTYTEWEESKKVLPKFGQKEYEPNNSWLENVQIEKNLKNCKDLLNIERVERISQLAVAEWLPQTRKARVIKKSGQDWGNFGIEVNKTLFLLPEESLLLLEMNCLELTWNGVALSIQQAYDILIDNKECTLEEYRVYSQLTRYGYHIQRFYYENSVKNATPDESVSLKIKVIGEPEKGLRMGDSERKESRDANNQPKEFDNSKDDLNILEGTNHLQTDKSDKVSSNTIEKDVESIIEKMKSTIECKNDSLSLISKYYNNKLENDQSKLDSKKEEKTINEGEKVDNSKNGLNSQIRIISEKTLSVKNRLMTKNDTFVTKWSDSRIQRNIKLLPKRSEISSLSVNNKSETKNLEGNNTYKRKEPPLSCGSQSDNNKKSKLEVIDLSDDEIQIVVPTLTRMEILELLPNIASRSDIVLKISRNYIPHTIKLCKDIYRYETKRLRNLSEIDSKMRLQNSKRNVQEIQRSSNTNFRDNNEIFYNQNTHTNTNNFMRRTLFTMQSVQYSRVGFYQFANNRFPFYHQTYWQNRGTFIQRNINHNNSHGYMYENSRNYRSFRNTQQQNRLPSISTGNIKSDKNEYQSSFKVLPNVTSWKELKDKWHDERTITIDDEDCTNNSESTEIEIVKERVSPLVGPKSVSSIAEIYNKLRIIKNAPDKTVRKKRNEFKISYNVYSNTQHYRKGNPGEPLYRLVVISKKDSPLLQPIKLNRLQQDAKGTAIMFAIVSMSISYIQPGIVSIPLLS
ncbi:PREDICTED: uncharacterized protein LOC107073016 [Polistes dominula]|uniref:Uncharacterized protein LOC107073016 n=1 Tax=Polistes dominula TaxID=743375 RepID=A0ABM1J8U8_POLDO|nr:PREDICTED: uncharacterized protein LOC107073016 [Polistes dominula]